MRHIQRRFTARLLGAALLALALTATMWSLGAVALMAGLFLTSGVILFGVLSVLPDLIAHRRGHCWRWWWQRGDNGPFWLGTRVPRHPRLPLLPALGAQAVPSEDDW